MFTDIMKALDNVSNATEMPSEIQCQAVETAQNLLKDSNDLQRLARIYLNDDNVVQANSLMNKAFSQRLKAYDLIEKAGLSEQEQQNLIKKLNSDEEKDIQREEIFDRSKAVPKTPREELSDHLQHCAEIAERETEKAVKAMNNSTDLPDYINSNSSNYIRRYDAVMDAYYDLYPGEKSTK